MEEPKHRSVRIGEVLAGKYRVDGVLGEGGMGVVVAAHHLQLDERVALKFLLPEALANEEAVMRFEQEARAAVKITSEHVARVLDIGALESGAPYIVMELLDGCDLSAWIRERGRLAVEQAVEFVLQACEAIAEAHSLGIVHRDLKPANLFVVRRNDGVHSVKVLDFGISKVQKNGPGDMAGTKTSVIMGSPLYMSPEQMRASKDVDPQSDIWALGVILYELLAGQTPFMAETYAEICVRVMTEPPAPLRDVRPDVPPALAAAIEKCLEKDRSRRHADVAELALSLQEFSPRRAKGSIDRINGILGRERASVLAALLAPPPDPTATMSPFGRTTGVVRAMKRGSWGFSAATAAIAVVAVSVGAFGSGLVRPSGLSHAVSAAVFSRLGPTTDRAPEKRAAIADPLPDHAPPPATDRAPDPVAVVALPLPSALPAPAPFEHELSATPAIPPLPEATRAAKTTLAQPPMPARRHSVTAAHGGAIARAVAISATSPGPSAIATSEPTSKASLAGEPAPSSASAADCETPFYFDANGTRVFKRECFH